MAQITVADVVANFDDYASGYSDLFKGLNGFRPRGSLVTPQLIADFFNNYDDMFAIEEAREEAELVALRESHGIDFANWHAYYDWLEAKDEAERRAYYAELEAEEAEKREFLRRGSPMPFIIDWEHGRNEFRVC